MKLIVESGATKSNWVVLKDDQVLSLQQLEGINVTSNPTSVRVIRKYNTSNLDHLDSIHFYGAGLGSSRSKDILRTELKSCLNASTIQIETDIEGAARSVSNNTPSIVSILGTGINTVVYDGKKIIQNVKSLGYLIFDAGSGFNMGQQIIKAYFHNEMEEKDKKQLEQNFMPHNAELIPYLYGSEKPNFEIAKFSKFLQVCHPDLKSRIVTQSFKTFFEQQINPLKAYQKYKLTFVGSIAAAFESELRATARTFNREILKIEGDPLKGLLEYHKAN